MSFFGLTSFGPESIIQSSLINSNGFSLYSDEEFYTSYHNLLNDYNTHIDDITSTVIDEDYFIKNKDKNKDKEKHNSLKVKDIGEVLKNTFGFKALDTEISLLHDILKRELDENMTWDDFISSIYLARGIIYYY